MVAAIILSALIAPTNAPAGISGKTVLEPFFLETEAGNARTRSAHDFVLRYLAISVNGSTGTLPALTISLWGSALPEGADIEIAYWATPTGGNAPAFSARARTRGGRIGAIFLSPSSEFLVPTNTVVSVKISVDSSRFLPGELWVSDGTYVLRYLYR